MVTGWWLAWSALSVAMRQPYGVRIHSRIIELVLGAEIGHASGRGVVVGGRLRCAPERSGRMIAKAKSEGASDCGRAVRQRALRTFISTVDEKP